MCYYVSKPGKSVKWSLPLILKVSNDFIDNRQRLVNRYTKPVIEEPKPEKKKKHVGGIIDASQNEIIRFKVWLLDQGHCVKESTAKRIVYNVQIKSKHYHKSVSQSRSFEFFPYFF